MENRKAAVPPAAIPEACASVRNRSKDNGNPVDLNGIHAAFIAGYDKGLADGRAAATEDLARALLHEQACEMAGIATITARRRFGNVWARAIAEAAGEPE